MSLQGRGGLGHIRPNRTPNGLQAPDVIQGTKQLPTQILDRNGQVVVEKWNFPFLDLIFLFEECKELPCSAFVIGEGSEKLWGPK